MTLNWNAHTHTRREWDTQRAFTGCSKLTQSETKQRTKKKKMRTTSTRWPPAAVGKTSSAHIRIDNTTVINGNLHNLFARAHIIVKIIRRTRSHVVIYLPYSMVIVCVFHIQRSYLQLPPSWLSLLCLFVFFCVCFFLFNQQLYRTKQFYGHLYGTHRHVNPTDQWHQSDFSSEEIPHHMEQHIHWLRYQLNSRKKNLILQQVAEQYKILYLQMTGWIYF